MNDMYSRRDPTRPLPPAFTKLTAQTDLLERNGRKKVRAGLVAHPMLLARMDGKKGVRDGGAG